MVEKTNGWGKVATILICAVLFIIALCCLIPLWHVLISSISDGQRLLAHEGVVFWPQGKVTLDGYRYVFRDSRILLGYANSLMYVAGQVLFGFVINVLGGYVLSRKPKLAPALTIALVLTMMFSGGTVPTYMNVRRLGMVGTRWALMIPGCTNAIFVMMAVRAFAGVPEATVEAAKLDGAGHIRTMLQVMLPQAMGLISVSLINTGILAWNAWFQASIYVTTQQNLWPLQLWIRQISSESTDFLNYANPDYSRYLIQFVVIVIATLPILIVFPFFQKKLEQGMMAGAVKE